MHVIRNGLVCFVAVCLASSAALAQKGEGPRGGEKGERGKAMFAKMDTDGNGTVSLGEFSAAHEKRLAMRKEKMGEKWNEERAAKMPAAADIFKKMDGDGNGELTREEMRAAHEKRMEAGKGKRDRDRKRDGEGDSCPAKHAEKADVEA